MNLSANMPYLIVAKENLKQVAVITGNIMRK